MSEAIIILGASALQVPLINYIKSSGYRVIVVSVPGNYPGFRYADRCIYCDIRDGEKILEQICNEKIVAVLTDQTDISVPTVAYLTTKLGLSGNSIDIARIYSNKHLMRNVLDDLNLPNLHHIRISKIEDAKEWKIYPAILKPEDSQGSRGVYKVNSYNELCEVLETTIAFSYSKFAILEEFFYGQEIVVEGFVQNGEYINFGVGDRHYFEIKDKFIPSQTIFPTNINSTLIEKILDVERRIHSYLSPHFGMIHSEYLVNVQLESFCVVETALRGGGVYISSHLVPLYTGFCNYHLLLDCALGKEVNLKTISQNFCYKASSYMCFHLPAGKIISIEGVEMLCQLEGVELCDLADLHVGGIVEPMQNKTHRKGPIILRAANRKMLGDLIDRIKNIFQVEVLTPNGLIDSIKW